MVDVKSKTDGLTEFDTIAAELINELEFDNIHKVMTMLNWTYYDNSEVPTIDILKETAYYVLRRVYDGGFDSYDGGGFFSRKVECKGATAYELRFCVDYSTYYPEAFNCLEGFKL